ncbi:MAG: hypothetical protein PHW47_12680 [Lachnospira sp.]|nr:hypothetical protein [Lachnospira sp.]
MVVISLQTVLKEKLEEKMDNLNQTLKWIDTLGDSKITIEKEIIMGTKNRGIYGIFVNDIIKKTEYCAYVGRAVNIYSRFLSGKYAHFVKLKKGKLENSKIVEALNDKNKRIEVRVLENVKFNYEDYCKDTQFMASRECYYIDYYQALNQCLEQCPDGSNVRRKVWENEKMLSSKA